jgi:steroid 5-alpha reductase family enzyme
MTCLWVIQLKTGVAAIVDLGWSLCMLIATVAYSLYLDGEILRRLLIILTAGFWAARLAYHIYVDRVRPGKEDGRYIYLKSVWGSRANFNLFWFFQTQAVAAVIFSLPWYLIAQSGEANLRWVDLLGVVIFVIAICGESIADHQLSVFRRNPAFAGKVCRVGFWRYTRHPNYFFEWLHWWAYVCFAYGVSMWWLVILSPVAMFILLTKYTGIPYTEMQASRSRGDDYREYQQTTNAFFPWKPRARTSLS